MRRLLLAALLIFVPAAAQAVSPIDSTNMTYDSGHGTQVEYLGRDGSANLWYPGNAIILHGRWKQQGANLCFNYGPHTYNPVTHVHGAKWECESTSLYDSLLVEQANGDVFRLARRSAAPYPLPSNRVTLEQLASKIGLGLELGEVHHPPPARPKPVTSAEAVSACAAMIAKAHASRMAMLEAASTYFHGTYMGRRCVAVDYDKAFALLKQIGDRKITANFVAILKGRATSGNPEAANALVRFGYKP